MKFIDASGVDFACPVTFSGGITPEISLANIDSMDISGHLIAATYGTFGSYVTIGTDLTVGDDLTVVDDASVGGDLSITGSLIAGGDFGANGNGQVFGTMSIIGAATLDSTISVAGATTLGSTLGVTGASTLAAVTCTTLAASGAITGSSTLAIAGASTLHNTSVVGTLGVSSTSTLAATSITALTASTSLTVTGASIVGLTEHITLDIPTLVGSGVYGLPSPVAGTIVKIQSWLKAALTTGDATLTAKIANTAVTNGALTITQAASARGDVDVCNPTAANVVAVGSNINLTVGGTNDAVVGATVVISILRSA